MPLGYTATMFLKSLKVNVTQIIGLPIEMKMLTPTITHSKIKQWMWIITIRKFKTSNIYRYAGLNIKSFI